MNRIFRLVWSGTHGTWIATSEWGRRGGSGGAVSVAGAILVVGAGMTAPPAMANCVAVATAITCSTAGGDETSTVGAGPASNDTRVDVLAGALVTTGDSSAISLNDRAAVTVRAGATVRNASTGGNSPHGSFGANTIEVNNDGTVTIERGGAVLADGSAGNSEAFNPLGANNTIINHGTVRSTQSAIWFQSGSGRNTVVNTGTIEAGYRAGLTNDGSTAAVSGEGVSALDFTNKGAVIGTLDFKGGDDVLRIHTGSSIVGAIRGGGGANLLTLESDDGATDTFAPSSLSGFQTLESNGGTWRLDVALPTSDITSVTVRGGTLALGADASGYTGGMAVEQAAILQSTAQFAPRAIRNAGRVRFAQPTDGTYDGLVSGTGGMEKTGAGVLTLTTDQAFTGATTITQGTLRLGDGGSAGSVQGDIVDNAILVVDRGDTLKIATVVSGTGEVRQAGAGTTVLTGANTYRGGTTIERGTLQLGDGGTSGGIVGDVRNDGVLAFVRSDDQTFAGAISGHGSVRQRGTGTTVLSGRSTYDGATTVVAGTLRAGAVSALSALSAHDVAAGATLDVGGFDQTVASLVNGGTVSLQGATPGTTLTVTGAYVGSGGLLKVGTALGDSGSATDRLVLDGAGASASGSTTVRVTNIGGLGAQTTGNGIELVAARNGATSTATAFALAGGHVDAGAFEYRLHGTDRGWYLRSTTDAVVPVDPTVPVAPVTPVEPVTPVTPVTPVAPATPITPVVVDKPAPAVRQVPTYRNEVPLFAALPQQLRQADLAMAGNLHQRLGGGPGVVTGDAAEALDTWGRVVSTGMDMRQRGTVAPASAGRLQGFQVGTDLLAGAGWRAGVYVGQLGGDLRTSGFARSVWGEVGSNDLRARHLGLYGTWTGGGGFYADAVLQVGDHRYTLQPDGNPSVAAKGRSTLASLEVGRSFALGGGWTIEPQLQLVRQTVDLDDASISGALVRQDATRAWIARAGARLQGETGTSLGSLTPYGRINLYRASAGTDVASFVAPAATTDIATRTGGTWVEAAAGAVLALGPAWSVYAEAGRRAATGGDARVKGGLQGSLGVKARW